MLEYRLYPISRDGKIDGAAIELVLPGDTEALSAAADQAHEARPLEIWQGVRRIGTVLTSAAAG